MRLDIVRANPSGNTTILVLTPVPPEKRPEISDALMAAYGGWAEQVGFVSGNRLDRLDMMGGEFCGNATLSLAAYRASQGLGRGGCISVSGENEPVGCSVSRISGGFYRGEVLMPLPEFVRLSAYPEGSFWTVAFRGMTHVILPRERVPGKPENVLKRWCDELEHEAMGMLIIDENMMKMRPLVYVRATDSAIWEHGCASGTAAVGAYLAVKSGETAAAEVSQPGGVISVRAEMKNGCLTELTVGGCVELIDRVETEVALN